MATAPRVVLVEADGAVRASLEFALELEGFDVEAVASADDLSRKELLSAGGCLIIDRDLRGTDGVSVLADLRRRGCTIPAILTATNPSRAVREAAARAGAALIEKPLLGDALSRRLRALLEPPAEVA